MAHQESQGPPGEGSSAYRMVSRLVVAIVLGALGFSLFSCGKESPTGVGSEVRLKRWTMMLYDDADFKQAYDPLRHFCREARSGQHVNVTVIQDTDSGPARLWYVARDHQPVLLQELGEVNMGSHQTLQDFIQYSKENYPAERYLIAFYNHGGAWRGACWDVTSGDDNLSMDEISRALMDAGGVDVVLFTAPCLMAAVESVYELRDATEFYIASEDLSGYCWWVYAIGDICDALNRSRPITNEDLARLTVESVWAHRDSSCPGVWPEQIIMSAIRTDRIGALAAALDTLSLEYLADLARFRYHMQLTFKDVQALYYDHVDVYDFAWWFRRIAYKPSLQQALDNIKRCTEEAVVAECHGSAKIGHGLNLYFPGGLHPRYEATYGSTELGLDFARDTHWDDLLLAYFSGTTSLQQGPPMPPVSDGFLP
jgi:hypothetical protein